MSIERLKMVEDMLDKNPNDTFLNYAAALEYKKIDEDEKAIKLLEHILKLDEKYLATYYQLGKLLERNKNEKRAIDIYKKGIKLAIEANDSKAIGELTEALLMLDEEFS